MGSQGCFPCRIPKAAPNCPQSKKGLGSGPVLLVQSRVYLGLVLGLWGYLCAHSPVSPPVTPTGGGATATARPGLCLTVGEKTSWNGLGKLPALPKRKDPQHPHPSLHIPLPVCGRDELPPCPCSPKMILFHPILHDFLVPPRNQPEPGEFGALQEKEAKSLWPREQPRLYFIPLQGIIWNSTFQGRRCCMNSNQG